MLREILQVLLAGDVTLHLEVNGDVTLRLEMNGDRPVHPRQRGFQAHHLVAERADGEQEQDQRPIRIRNVRRVALIGAVVLIDAAWS